MILFPHTRWKKFGTAFIHLIDIHDKKWMNEVCKVKFDKQKRPYVYKLVYHHYINKVKFVRVELHPSGRTDHSYLEWKCVYPEYALWYPFKHPYPDPIPPRDQWMPMPAAPEVNPEGVRRVYFNYLVQGQGAQQAMEDFGQYQYAGGGGGGGGNGGDGVALNAVRHPEPQQYHHVPDDINDDALEEMFLEFEGEEPVDEE